jgi:hypothetical protein
MRPSNSRTYLAKEAVSRLKAPPPFEDDQLHDYISLLKTRRLSEAATRYKGDLEVLKIEEALSKVLQSHSF